MWIVWYCVGVSSCVVAWLRVSVRVIVRVCSWGMVVSSFPNKKQEEPFFVTDLYSFANEEEEEEVAPRPISPPLGERRRKKPVELINTGRFLRKSP